MLILHGTWQRSPEDPPAGAFFIWGEASARRRPRGRPRSKRSAIQTHPFQAGREDLHRALETLRPESFDPRALTAVSGQTTFLLPSSASTPVASSTLIDESERDDESAAVPRLVPWNIDGLSLSPGSAALWLSLRPEAPGEAPGGDTLLGSDLRFWSAVSKFALELIARQRYVPCAMAYGEGPKQILYAFWQPVLDDPGDAQRIARLAEAMPPVCRAGVIHPSNGSVPPPPARALILGFLTAALDGLLRQWVSPTDRPGGSRRVSEEAPLSEKWTVALFSNDPTLAGAASDRRILQQSLAAWLAPVGAPGEVPPFRTCFRLEAPELSPERSVAAAKPKAKDWILRYFLQATDDLSLLVPASKVWRKSGEVSQFLSRRFDRPQEKLLLDLGRAARLFPPFEASLRIPRPEDCALTTEEAFAFLRENAWLLEESGFGVLVPPWWDRAGARGARLGVRLELKGKHDPGTKVGQSFFGLQAVTEYNWQLAIGEDPLTAEEFEKIAALKVPLVRVRGQWVALSKDDMEQAVAFWKTRAKGGILVVDALRVGLGGEAPGLPVTSFHAEGWLQDFLNQLTDSDRLSEFSVPENLHATLRPYQARGYSWLIWMRQRRLGACLADDMGLGKTLEFLTFLLYDKAAQPDRAPTLLICPTSVVGNWQREVTKFAPSLRVLIHHGTGRQTGAAFARAVTNYDLVISTYSLAHRDAAHLTAVKWEGIVLDEAQNIKNPGAKQTQAIRRLSTGYRMALTGTPVENRLSELWSIMEFLNPGYLGPAAVFRRRFAIPIELNREVEPRTALRRLVAPFILRRVKTDPRVIQDLPEKMEMKVFCTLTREQATLYEAVVGDMLDKIERAEGIERKGLVLAVLMKLKQVCNHPAQFLKDGSAIAGRSGKLERLGEMLEEALSEGDRCLLFTQFFEMGELLRKHLQNLFGREVLFLHGGVAQKKRERMIDRFQNEPDGPPIFLLSLKAGGVGLNLMRANRVFHFDRWWNPAVENQATDRAFRIGQTRNVQVHKFVCLGTLEERIDAMIEAKKELSESIVGAGENWITEMSTAELRDLFQLRRVAFAEG